MKFICIRLLVIAVFLILLSNAAQALDMVSVDSDIINVRSGPGIDHEIKWEYGKGFPLIVVKKRGDWYFVRDFENDTGWVYKNLVSRKRSMIVKVFKDSSKNVNIRSGPGTKHPVVGKAFYGVVFETLSLKNDWVNVRHESGLTGWVKRSLLWGF